MNAEEMDQLGTPLLADEDEGQSYVPERRRWGVLLAFSLANMANAMMWVTFAPIASLAESFYGVSDTKVNAFSVSYLITYIPGSLAALAVYSNKRDGLWRGVVIAAILTAAGAALRYAASKRYAWTLTGQYLAAMAQPFLTNVPPKVAAAWFPSEERDVATVVASMANPVGIAVGSILPALLVKQQDNDKSVVIGMDTLLLVEAVLATIVAVVAAVVIKSHPSTPPSAAAEKEVLEESFDDDESVFRVLSHNIMVCLKNGHFLLLLVAFGIGLGMFNALSTLIEQLIAPFCYSDDDASLFAGLLLGCGLLSAGLVGIYLDKTHQYRFVLKVLFSLATATLLLYSFILRPHFRGGLAVVFALLGVTMLPILPTAMEAAVECTYPIPEEVSTGLLMSAGMLTGIGFIFGLQKLADMQPTCDKYSGYYYVAGPSVVLLVSGIVATATIWRFDGPLLRLEQETNAIVEGDRGSEEELVEDVLVSELLGNET